MKATTAFVVISVAGIVGCAGSVAPPNDQWAAAQADLGRAQAGGAPGDPDARLHLQLAEEDLQAAKRLIGTDNERATTLTELASTEAQFALTLAKSSAARQSAQEAAAEVRKAQGK
jgi:hypothetical protein